MAEHALDVEPRHRVDGARRLQCVPRLREDVVRELVGGERAAAGHVERAVARRAPAAQLVDAHALRRDADPHVALAQVTRVPERVEVVARR